MKILRVVPLCLLLSFSVSSFSKLTSGPALSMGAAGGSVSYGSGRAAVAFTRMVNALPGSAARVVDNIRVGLPGGAIANMSVGRVIARGALAAAVGVAVGAGVGAVAVAVGPLLWDALREQGVVPGPDGTAHVDPGRGQEQGYCYASVSHGACASPGVVMEEQVAIATNICLGNSGGSITITSQSINNGASGAVSFTLNYRCYYVAGNPPDSILALISNSTWSQQGVLSSICVPTVMPSIRVTGPQPCPSDVRQKASTEQVVLATNAIGGDLTPAIVEELIPKVDIDAESAKLSGPAVVTSPNPTVVTRPDGSVETTTRNHTITYSDDTFNYTTSIVTVNNAGDTTVVENPPVEQKTDCDKFPDSLGCADLGEVDHVDLPKMDLPVAVGAQGGWGAGDSACPAPRVVTVLGQSIEIDNSLFCQFLSGIRFAVIGAFGVAAVLLFVGGIKQ